jgi:hypothetical protein
MAPGKTVEAEIRMAEFIPDLTTRIQDHASHSISGAVNSCEAISQQLGGSGEKGYFDQITREYFLDPLRAQDAFR